MGQRWIDPTVYRAAMKRVEHYDASQLEADLHNVTRGKRNTLLNLAATAGNLNFIKHLLQQLKLEDEFVLATNANGDTALHEAARRGHQHVVEVLLRRHKDLLGICNNLGQTPLFKACESGHLGTVKTLVEADLSPLRSKSSDGRTCLHVTVNRPDPELLQYLLKEVDKKDNLTQEEKDNLIQEQDNKGNTVLHLALQRNFASTVTLLLGYQPDLCYSLNKNEETPLCIAVKLGFFDVVQALVNSKPDSIEIQDTNRKNVLHLAVEHRRVSVVQFLIKETEVSQLINQPDEALKKDEQSREQDQGVDKGKDPSTKEEEEKAKYLKSGGNTPLHNAASIKNFHIVELLEGVPGVNKAAVNNEGLTPLEIARDNTEYHESYKLIAKLTSYPPKKRPFQYNAPMVSETKHKKSVQILEKAYSDRRNTELVVAVLLATMAFSAVFQIPGGFRTEEAPSPFPAMAPPADDHNLLGSPILIEYDSFKVFLIFDIVAFFLSLFVVVLWTVSTPLSTGDQMLFMCITVMVTCVAFACITYGFMCAVYTMLWYDKYEKLAWVVLGSSMLICLGGNLACFYIVAKFAVRRARFHILCGVPRLLDRAVEHIWIKAERMGILDFLRYINDKSNRALISGQGSQQTTAEDKGKSGAGSSSSAPLPEDGQERV